MPYVSPEAVFIEKCAELTAAELGDYLHRALDAFLDFEDKVYPRRSTTYDELIELLEQKQALSKLPDLSPKIYSAVVNILDGRGEPWRKDLSQKRLLNFNRKKFVVWLAWFSGFGLGGKNFDQLESGVEEIVIERIEKSDSLAELFSKSEPLKLLDAATNLKFYICDELEIPRDTVLADLDLLAIMRTVNFLGDLRFSNREDVITQLSQHGASALLLGIFQDLYIRIADEDKFQLDVDQAVAEICGPVSLLRERKALVIEEMENRLSNDSPVFSSLPWKLLPPGKDVFERLESHFRAFEKGNFSPERPIDYSRLKRIQKSLCPSYVHVGRDGFEGYVVYGFNSTNWVILECPVYGNATYILKDNWQTISRLSKWEARQEHSNQVIVIRHTESWFSRLLAQLKSSNKST